MGRAAPHSRGPVASRKRDNRDSAPVGAPPTPLRGGRERKERTRAQQRAAGTNNTALFDIVRRMHGAWLVKRANERRVRAPSLSCPGRASVRERRAGPRGYTANRGTTVSRSVPWVPALVPFGFASLHSAGTRELYSLAPQTLGAFGETNPRCKKATMSSSAGGPNVTSTPNPFSAGPGLLAPWS